MLGTIPPVLVMKDLVASGAPLKLHDVHRLDAGSLAGGIAGIDPLDVHSFRKKIELTHASAADSFGSLSR